MALELEWRRNWNPLISALSWQPLVGLNKTSHSTGSNFLVKCRFHENSYSLFITECVHMWSEVITEVNIKKRCKRLNPNLEAPMQTIMDHISKSLEGDTPNTELSMTMKAGDDEGSDICVLSLENKLADYHFKWKFIATPCDTEEFSKQMTMPMLTMIGELQRRQNELCKILKAKDKQIEDFKMQGVKNTRKHLETPAFDKIVFTNTMNTSKEFERQVQIPGSSVFNSEGQSLYQEVVTKDAWVKHKEDSGIEDANVGAGASIQPTGGVASWADRVPPSVVTPTKNASPEKLQQSPSPAKDSELLRRQALERKLQEQEQKKDKKAKKKKIKF